VAFPHESGEVDGSSAMGVDRRRWRSGGCSCAVQSGGEKGVGEKEMGDGRARCF
jgi:hypothetical protein